MHRDQYSAFDERGIPTHSVDGEPLTKTAMKKLRKKQERLIADQQKAIYKRDHPNQD
jgi:hypothetical protein